MISFIWYCGAPVFGLFVSVLALAGWIFWRKHRREHPSLIPHLIIGQIFFWVGVILYLVWLQGYSHYLNYLAYPK
ncbi:hypothetical protein ANRL4_00786 [Anaerolineae bacterium]|nr:hypothetical protein ANRL4_00786 [Anaerolineae bacterium]